MEIQTFSYKVAKVGGVSSYEKIYNAAESLSEYSCYRLQWIE